MIESEKDIREKFEKLYNEWRDKTCIFSDTGSIFNNDEFRRLIDMGASIVPYVIELLKKNKQDWKLIHILDELYPGLVEYKGYVKSEDAADVWIQLLYELYMKDDGIDLTKEIVLTPDEQTVLDLDPELQSRFYETSSYIGQLIQSQIDEMGIDIYDLAEISGVVPFEAMFWVSGRCNFQLSTMIIIEKVLGIQLFDLVISDK